MTQHWQRDRWFSYEGWSRNQIYSCGHSLGLSPKTTMQELSKFVHDWQALGVEGHFHADTPWVDIHNTVQQSLADLAGANKEEVVAMNTLTTNLHLLLTAFYKRDLSKSLILMEPRCFPSDYLAVHSYLSHLGLDPEAHIVFPESTSDGIVLDQQWEQVFEMHGDRIQLVWISAVHYLTGQAYDIVLLSALARKYQAKLGLDLAHALGNISLQLHHWGVDFAVWCSYKYLNAGPGGIGGLYVHQKWHQSQVVVPLRGWWGQVSERRFEMALSPDYTPTIEGWQASNPSVVLTLMLKCSLNVFEAMGTNQRVRYRDQLIAAQMDSFGALAGTYHRFRLITPLQRGSMSAFTCPQAEVLFRSLTLAGIVCDFRSPSIIRTSFVPLYNTVEEVHRFATIVENHLMHA